MNLSDRMKAFENVNRTYLPPRMPIILRIDGCHFHSYTKGLKKPWDVSIQNALTKAAESVMQASGAELAYIQSDEISLVLNTYKKFDTQAWFGGNVQKIASVGASVATAAFNLSIPSKCATFDCRCFALPKEEACNYFLWRQRDAIRNSVSSLARQHYSPKQLHKKTVENMKEMLLAEKSIDWDKNISLKNQRGWCVVKDGGIREDVDIPLFSECHWYIEQYLLPMVI